MYHLDHLRDVWAGFLASERFDTLITLTTNDDSCPDYRGRAPSYRKSNHRVAHMQRLLRDWEARVCRELLGRNWQKRPALRLRGIAILEHLETNTHWHIVVARKDTQISFAALQLAAHKHWTRLVRGADVEVKPKDGRQALGRYLKKEFWLEDARDAVFFLGPKD